MGGLLVPACFGGSKDSGDVVQAPIGQLTLSVSHEQLTADGRSVASVSVSGVLNDGTLPADSTQVELDSSLGALGAISLVGGEGSGVFVAGTWPGTASFSSDVWDVNGDTALELVQGAALSAALHLHGSISEGNAPMLHHVQQAETYGVDVLWWSDHQNLYHPEYSMEFPGEGFETGSLEGAGSDKEGVSITWQWELLEAVDVSVSEVIEDAARSGDFGWHIGARGPSDGGSLTYGLSVDPEIHKYPLLADVSFEFSLYPVASAAGGGALFLRIPLSASSTHGSWHYREDFNEIVFVHGEYTPTGDPSKLFVPLEASAGQWTEFSFNLSELAEGAFPDLGRDQHAEPLLVQVSPDPGVSNAYFLDDIHWSLQIVGEDLRTLQAQYLEALKAQPTQHIGVELSRIDVFPHMNAFGSEVPLISQNQMFGWSGADQVSWAQDYGGIVSCNHMFGMTGAVLTDEERAEAVEDQIELLTGEAAFGCDLIEIGYRERGGLLEDFLSVWDALGLEGVWITGLGTTDLHDTLDYTETDNNFVTWVSTASDSESDIGWNLRRGAAWFGDPTFFDKSHVDVRLAAPDVRATMGQVVTAGLGTQTIDFEISYVEAGWVVRMIGNGAEIVPEWTVEADGVFEISEPVEILTDTAIRFEVWSEEGVAILFTNPIYFVDGSRETSAERVPTP